MCSRLILVFTMLSFTMFMLLIPMFHENSVFLVTESPCLHFISSSSTSWGLLWNCIIKTISTLKDPQFSSTACWVPFNLKGPSSGHVINYFILSIHMVFLVKYKRGLPLPSFAREMIFLPLSLKGWATPVSSYTAAAWYKYLFPLIEQLWVDLHVLCDLLGSVCFWCTFQAFFIHPSQEHPLSWYSKIVGFQRERCSGEYTVQTLLWYAENGRAVSFIPACIKE